MTVAMVDASADNRSVHILLSDEIDRANVVVEEEVRATRRLIELSGLQSLAASLLMRRNHSGEVGPLKLVLPAQQFLDVVATGTTVIIRRHLIEEAT